MLKRSLAIDIGKNMAVAIFDGARLEAVTFHKYKTTHEVVEGGIYKVLDKVAKAATIEGIYFEEPMGHISSAASLWQQVGVIRCWAALNGVPVKTVHPLTLKKHFTGTGKADKESMLGAAINLYPKLAHLDINDHQADAVLIGAYFIL